MHLRLGLKYKLPGWGYANDQNYQHILSRMKVASFRGKNSQISIPRG